MAQTKLAASEPLSGERKSELYAVLGLAPLVRKPKLVCLNGRTIARTIVIVSPADPNWFLANAFEHNGAVYVEP
jgi:hypothetical protein